MWKHMFPEHPLNSSGAGVEAGEHRDDASSFRLCPRDLWTLLSPHPVGKTGLSSVHKLSCLSCEERICSKKKETHSKQLVSDYVRTSFFRLKTLSLSFPSHLDCSNMFV